jgi:signal transduction histidine kinase
VAIGGFRLRVRNVEARSRELESQVVSRTKELAALNAVAAVVSRSLDLQQVLTNALDKTLEIIEVEAGGIYILQEEDDVLTMVVHKGFDAKFVGEVDNLKVGEGFSGRVVQTGQPLIVPELATDPRLTRSVVRESDFHSLAVVPLVSRARVLGTLTVVTRGHREFSQQDIELLTSIGDQIGVAVENAQLYEQAQQAAVVEERQRLARELHDSISQSLHSSILLAEAGQRLASAGDLERSRGYLVRLGEISQHAMKEMRLLVYELRPLALREAGLEKALQQRLDTVERRAGVEAKLEVEGEVEIPADVEEALFRIAQEALNNAMNHASATSVVVTIRLEADPPDRRVVLEVADNGLGFDRDSLGDEGGIGLDSMRERVEKIGGVLTIASKPGEGTHVKASVPMKAPTDSKDLQELGGT